MTVSAQDVLQVCLETGAVQETHRLTSAAHQTDTHKATIGAGHLTLQTPQMTLKTTLASSTWIPVAVHVGRRGTVYVLNVSRRNRDISTQVHEWRAGTQLQCTKTVTFEDPCFVFTTVGAEEKWCCLWPKKKGYVVQDADGHGNSLTC